MTSAVQTTAFVELVLADVIQSMSHMQMSLKLPSVVAVYSVQSKTAPIHSIILCNDTYKLFGVPLLFYQI